MHLPSFDKEHVRWDRYKAFHIGVIPTGICSTDYWQYPPPFVQFKDGQLMCAMSRPAPHLRRVYPLLDVQLVATRDYNCPPLFFPDGEPVPKAWLNDNGQQYLLIDLTHKRAVRLASGGKLKTRLPKGARGSATTWFSGPGLLPVGAPIALRKPFNSLPKETQQMIDNRIYSWRAAMMLLDHPASKLKTYQSWVYTRDPNTGTNVRTPVTRTYTESFAELSLDRLLSLKNWTDMRDENEQRRFFFAGVDKRPRELIEYLVIA